MAKKGQEIPVGATPVLIRIPNDIMVRLDVLMEVLAMTRSHLIVEAVREYIEKEDDAVIAQHMKHLKRRIREGQE